MTRVKHCAFVLIVAITAVGSYGQVTFERLVNAAKEPQNWLTYSGDYAGRRFSPLDQINTANARSLVAKWVYQTAATGKFGTTPLVVDGILYATGQDDRAFALDARTGRPIWRICHPRRQSVHSHARCSRHCARREDRKRYMGYFRGRL